jgi:hypothetical protein
VVVPAGLTVGGVRRDSEGGTAPALADLAVVSGLSGPSLGPVVAPVGLGVGDPFGRHRSCDTGDRPG